MKPHDLVEQVLAVAKELHPTYTHAEHMAWVAGFLAKYVLAKNHMDNIVYVRLAREIELLRASSPRAE